MYQLWFARASEDVLMLPLLSLVLLGGVFAGVLVWVVRGRGFDVLARMPLEDDKEVR